MNIDYPPRRERVMKWYAPARFGLFYSYGLFTGGEDYYSSPAEFEEAAPEPEVVAKNLVATALHCGAKYITLTLLHTSGKCCVLFPTKQKGFKYKTSKDYAGALIRECAQKGVRLILYMPGPGVPEYLTEGYGTQEAYIDSLKGLLSELVSLHGEKIGGFWIDGLSGSAQVRQSLLHHMRSILPNGMIVCNNLTELPSDDIDFGTTEFLAGASFPDYNRTAGLQYHLSERHAGIAIPGDDYNEDIPVTGHWWYEEKLPAHPRERRLTYVGDSNYLLRQMVSSLGQRGQWNFQIGLGPMIDGGMDAEMHPTLDRLHEFFSWGAESIYGTTGGLRSFIKPGTLVPGGFYSVTQKIDDPLTCYIIVTSANWSMPVMFHSAGIRPRSVVDLRTGEKMKFRMTAGITFDSMDWSDMHVYGVKVLKVQF